MALQAVCGLQQSKARPQHRVCWHKRNTGSTDWRSLQAHSQLASDHYGICLLLHTMLTSPA